jgi:hypothetical protein
MGAVFRQALLLVPQATRRFLIFLLVANHGWSSFLIFTIPRARAPAAASGFTQFSIVVVLDS